MKGTPSLKILPSVCHEERKGNWGAFSSGVSTHHGRTHIRGGDERAGLHRTLRILPGSPHAQLPVQGPGEWILRTGTMTRRWGP